jgi:hypothetical protein
MALDGIEFTLHSGLETGDLYGEPVYFLRDVSWHPRLP